LTTTRVERMTLWKYLTTASSDWNHTLYH